MSSQSMPPMGGPQMSQMGSGMPAPYNSGAPPMYRDSHSDPHNGMPMHGFGPEMMHQGSPHVEIRPPPHHQRLEHQELPEGKKEVLREDVILPGGQKLAHGSDKYALYGALEDLNMMEMRDQHQKLKRRRRINCIPALNSLFLPWVLFLIVYSLASFWVHYVAPVFTWVLNTSIVLFCVGYAYRAFKDPNTRPDVAFYPTYLAISFLLAVSLGWLLGDLNFWFNMHPAYNIEHLGTYLNVNPSQQTTQSGQVMATRGKRYQDAGKVYFDHKVKLDLNRSMSFKMGDLYCVAPIVDPTCKGTCGFDFWAVGINCCAEDVSDFRCGEYNNPAAKSGLRLMYDEQRPNFRLAVLEAEGVHKIVSTHPIFFHWLADPVKELEHVKRKGYKGFVLLMIVSFFFSAMCSYLALKWARDNFKVID
jgi:hypothetical protein